MHRKEGKIVSMSKRMFIVGSGFTRAVFGDDAPTNAALLPCLCQSEPTFWQEIVRRYKTNDIEVALTKLDLDLNKAEANKAELVSERQRIETSLARFFRKFRFSEHLVESRPWIEPLMHSLFSIR